MREKMRRRSKRGPNTSEATGNTGQEIPTNQPAALRPNYPEANCKLAASGEDTVSTTLESAVASADDHDFEQGSELTADESEAQPDTQPGKIVLETQPDSLSTPPAEAQPVGSANGAAPAPKGYVVLAIGLPGSGKTTWYKRRGVTPLSSDMLRNILFDDITDQRYSGLVFSTLRSLLRARLIAKMPWNYVDATNLSAHERRQWIKMAKSFGYEAQAVFFDVPLSVCMERNSRRDRRVADDVMEKLSERLRPPSFREGFSKITVVRVKGQLGHAFSATAEPTADSFNAPIPVETDADISVDLDEPSGHFEDAGTDASEANITRGSSKHPSQETDSAEGRAETLGHHSESDLDEPGGRLDTLSDHEGSGREEILGSHHGGHHSETESDDQPDTFE